MTTQEAYEKIRKWFTRPNAVYGYNEKEVQCQYRANEKARSLRRCAIGCLIPNRMYNVDLEGRPSTEVLERVPSLDGIDPLFVKEVQQTHDRCAVEGRSLSKFLSELDDIARTFELKVVQ